jgi:hypothetical protein
MVHWKTSYAFGKAQEERILPIIREYFNPDLQPTEGQYAKYDFDDETTNYELKSRTCKYNNYQDTMITFDKMCGCDKEKRLILLFNFTDGLYFIQYDETKFSHYRRELFSRARLDSDEKEHIFIPIEHLTLIKAY